MLYYIPSIVYILIIFASPEIIRNDKHEVRANMHHILILRVFSRFLDGIAYIFIALCRRRKPTVQSTTIIFSLFYSAQTRRAYTQPIKAYLVWKDHQHSNRKHNIYISISNYIFLGCRCATHQTTTMTVTPGIVLQISLSLSLSISVSVYPRIVCTARTHKHKHTHNS